jgi:hypothetical protein
MYRTNQNRVGGHLSYEKATKHLGRPKNADNLAAMHANDKLAAMTRAQVLVWSLFLLGVGGGVLTYLLREVPPILPNGQWNLPIIALFVAALATLGSGIGMMGALSLHRRWPTLGGASSHTPAKPEAALRQGVLLGGALTAIALFALLRTLDITFILVTLLFIGLVEAYLQSRQTG